MNPSTHRLIDSELMDEAVRASLEINAKSSVMFLLRERMLREAIEAAAPILVRPLLARINELESEVARLRGKPGEAHQTQESEVVPPAPKPNRNLDKLKDALDNMREAMDEDTGEPGE